MATTGKTSTTRTRWVGWIYFGGFVLLATGIVHVINGLVVLTRSNIAASSVSGTLVPVSLGNLGLSLLIGGFVLFAVGVGVFSGRTWARILAIVLVVLSIIGNIAVFLAFPVWSGVVIVLDIVVLYALSKHWREINQGRSMR
jgi:hypothetical protein